MFCFLYYIKKQAFHLELLKLNLSKHNLRKRSIASSIKCYFTGTIDKSLVIPHSLVPDMHNSPFFSHLCVTWTEALIWQCFYWTGI